MIAANDLVNIILRQLMLSGHARLIFDKGNRVLVVFSLDRKRRGHYLERNVGAHVQPQIVAMAQMRHAANDFEPESVDQNK